jgi:Putative Ig domain
LYAVASVKSNQGTGVNVAGIVRMVALAVFCLGAFGWAQTAPPLTIVDETLPSLDPGVEVRIPLTARGGVLPYHWSVTAGNLPEGISLTPEGVLIGRPTTLGRFAYTVTVEDSARPANRISKELQTVVSASLVLEWLRPPQARGDRIDGTVQVSNGTNDDFDLTFIVVAINEIGRATALGYQHFTLKAGTANFQIPFGQTLPRGAYIVHADAVAEIPDRNRILRRLLETPAPLPVTQGP